MEKLLPDIGIKPILLENALNWRYSTKVFNQNLQVPDDKFDLLLESLRLAPSSMGLQPWKFVVIKKKAVRKELLRLSMHQRQLVEASHLILLCSLKEINGKYIDELIRLEKELNQGRSNLEPFRAFALSFIESKSKQELREWMTRQIYIALGFLLYSCSLLHIDACPIESINHGKVNKLLGLHHHGIEARISVAIGYRSEADAHARDHKVRWPREKVILAI